MVSVAIIEDDVLIRMAVEFYLNAQPEFSVVTTYNSVELFFEHQKTLPHVILMDIQLPGMSGLEGCFKVKQQFPNTEILMFTVYEDKDKVFKALQAGASGYLLKNSSLDVIKSSILETLDGGAPMTPSIAKKVLTYFSAIPEQKQNESLDQLTKRELEVAKLLVDGSTYKQVAYHLKISADTVRQHIKNIYAKLQINSRIHLVQEFNKK